MQLLGTSPSTRKPDTRVVDFACQQLFCPGSCLEFSDQFLELKRELGIASIHFTGGGSNYMPWWPGLGYVWGADGTSEEGGTIRDPAELSRELAWMLLNGQGHHNFYYSAVDYMRLEQKTGWFTHHRRLLELVGKAGWQKPPVAVLRAAHSALYFPYDERGHAWDLGAGALQAAHYQNVYVTEAELKAGLADDYPVVFDAATRVMDDEILAGIERYRTPWPRYPGEKAGVSCAKQGHGRCRDATGSGVFFGHALYHDDEPLAEKDSRPLFSLLCLFWAVALGAAHVQAGEPGAAPVPQLNLLENGGFESWSKLEPNTARQAEIAGLRLEPANSTPTGWLPCRETYQDQPPTASLALDEQVRHSGQRSVRIENRDMRDITYVRYSTERFSAHPEDPHNLRPNRRYAIRWWVRGQDIAPAGTGPILMLHTCSSREGKTYGTPASEERSLPKGTFDWQPREFAFITDPYARWFTFTLQLRWTTGTVWYDDVELVDLGAVVNVETY